MNPVSSILASDVQVLEDARPPETPPTSPEAEVVLLCSKGALDEADKPDLRSRLSEPLDTEFLFDLAYRHGVLPLVCNNLLQNFPVDLPTEMKEMAEDFCRYHSGRNVAMTGKLVEIVRLLGAAGIRAVPFKGPTLSMKLYRSLTLRQFIDLDVLVMPKHFEKAVRLLIDRGYKLHSTSIPRKRQLFRIDRRKDASLIHPDDNIRVELHWKLSGSYFSMPLQLSSLWNRMDETVLAGTPIGTLPFNDLFVYLCLHAARHGFERLEWICDLNELVRTENGGDWESIRTHARIHGCERVLELSLFLVHHLFGTRPDYPDFHRIESDPFLRKTALIIRGRLFSHTASQNEIGEWYGYHLNLKEKRLDRVKLHLFYMAWYTKLIFRPNAADRTIFALPASFYPLYYVLRPARLLFNYFSNQATKR